MSLRGDFAPKTTVRALGVALLALAGCGSGDDGTKVGTPDVPQISTLRIDEAGIVGQVTAAGRLHVDIPLASPSASAGKGELTVAVLTVDGNTTLDTAQVPFQIGAAGAVIVPVELAAPAGVAEQPDWVAHVLRIKSVSPSGLQVTRSLLAIVGAYDVRLDGPATVNQDRTTHYRVRTEDPVTHKVLPRLPVTLTVRQADKVARQLSAVTDDKGVAVFDLALETAGAVTVEATATAQGTTSHVSDGAVVRVPGAKVLLTTDKPIYQPGQTIHLRALALDSATQKPVAPQAVLFEVQDGKGNKILKRSLTSDAYGLCATDFTLGAVLNMGTFQLRATVGADKAEKTVEVSRYALPKFKVDVATDKPFYTPGQQVSGTIDAKYFFGKVVAGGDVLIEASAADIGLSTFARVMGKTDGNGRYPYTIALPSALVGLPIQSGSALVTLHVEVTDTAGQKVPVDRPLTVAARSLRLALIPENTQLVPGIQNHLDLFVTDPLGGAVAGATVDASPAGAETLHGTTDAYGHLGYDWTPPATDASWLVQATASGGPMAAEQFMLGRQVGADHLLVRTDSAVYGIGDSVAVEVRTSPGIQTVYIDWLANGQVADLLTLDVKDGVARTTLVIDTGHVGSNRIEAYIVGKDGNIVRAGRTVFARGSGALSVDLTADQPVYAPGTPAKLTLSVKDETGAPAVAALGVQIVDEAVFALVDARPGLLRTYFQLEDQFAMPHYELRPPLADMSTLLFTETAATDHAAAAAAQQRAAAMLAALGSSGVTGIHKGSWDGQPAAVKMKLAPFFDAEKARLRAAVTRATSSAVTQLKLAGCDASMFFCSSQQKTFLQAVQDLVKAQLRAYDFWGNAYINSPGGGLIQLTSNGPDELAETADDQAIAFSAADVNLTLPNGGDGRGGLPVPGVGQGGPANAGNAAPGAMNPGIPAGSGGATTSGNAGTGGATAGAEPRVRSDFPETLYVNPNIITGPDGTATFTVDMADSITDWRVSTLAHSQSGKLGGGVGAVRVFQDFFVDISFPAALTRGDAVEFPIAVYNYLETPQTVHLELQPGDWFTATGATTLDVPLAAGQVAGVRFPVRVDRVGRQTLTVKAFGDKRSDAVARSVQVDPDGQAVPVALSGSLAAGSVTQHVTFPAEAIAGSQQLSLAVFPAYLSSVVQGMDSLLRVPNGCFEQTTSTAWPNVLVTDYLKQTGQLKPEIQLKAESLMSAGYQRLLTFEHKTGGFSWFGEQDPVPYLSVTAFGLMEFADMSKVQMVDPAMVDRTRVWMLKQQAGDGSWKGDMSEFFSFHTSLMRNTAFVVWALATTGYSGPELGKGLAFVKQQFGQPGGEKPDGYTLGILANAFLAAAPGDATTTMLVDAIAAAAKVDGDKATATWDTGGTQTNFYGGGNDGAVTATALAAHALLVAGGHKDLVDGALAFLTSSRDARGNFGSTQATIWTLRALLLAAKKGTESAVGSFAVSVDGTPFSSVMLTADQSDVMTTVDMATLATTGAHDITLTFSGTGKVSYNLVAQHSLPWAMMPPPPGGPLSVTLSYDKTKLAMDDTARATVSIRNNTRSAQNMILVTVGIPPGFQVMTEDLDAYKATNVLSSYELTGKQLLLYVSALPAGGKSLDLSYRVRATMPVRASDGGAAAYLYYEPAQRAVAAATTLEVTAAP